MRESTLQAECVKWFRYQYPFHVIFAIPNGGNRDIRQAVTLKREGVLSGVADLFVMSASGGYNGLFIEMKLPKTKQTENQVLFQANAESRGYKYVVCRTFEEFQETIIDYELG